MPARQTATDDEPRPDAPTGDPAELAARLRLNATRLARRLRRESATGLTPSQLSALATVERHGPVTLGFLAECERVAPPSVTRVVGKLVADGLLVRQIDGHDRRISRVSITARGTDLLAESRRRKDEWLASRIRALDPHDRDRLAAAVDVLDQLTNEDRRPAEGRKDQRR